MPGEDRLAITCDVAEGSPTPVRHWDTEGRGLDIAALSLTDTVATWVHMLDEGLVNWDGSIWVPSTDEINPDLWRRAAG